MILSLDSLPNCKSNVSALSLSLSLSLFLYCTMQAIHHHLNHTGITLHWVTLPRITMQGLSGGRHTFQNTSCSYQGSTQPQIHIDRLDNMEITSASSPEVNTYMPDRIKVAEYHAIYINFRKLVKGK